MKQETPRDALDWSIWLLVEILAETPMLLMIWTAWYFEYPTLAGLLASFTIWLNFDMGKASDNDQH